MQNRGYFEGRQVGDKTLYLSGNTTLLEHFENILVSAGGSAVSTPTITLPNVSQVKGRTFRFQCIDIDNTTTDRVIINYTNGTAVGNTTGLNTTDVHLEMTSNGLDWVLTRV